jgi:hypothetical protein
MLKKALLLKTFSVMMHKNGITEEVKLKMVSKQK